MNTLTINALNNGWYDFKDIPQDKSDVKIHALHCGTNRKAINQALKIARNNQLLPAYIEIIEDEHHQVALKEIKQ